MTASPTCCRSAPPVSRASAAGPRWAPGREAVELLFCSVSAPGVPGPRPLPGPNFLPSPVSADGAAMPVGSGRCDGSRFSSVPTSQGRGQSANCVPKARALESATGKTLSLDTVLPSFSGIGRKEIRKRLQPTRPFARSPHILTYPKSSKL